MPFVAKLAGCFVLAFVGYFIINAVGWPGNLDALVLERAIVGGAFIILAVLCALSAAADPKPAAARVPPVLVMDEPEPVILEPAPLAAPPIFAAAPCAVTAPACRELLMRGDTLFGEGRLDDASPVYAQALAIARDLHDAAPDAGTQDLLAAALTAVGNINDKAGFLDTAAAHYKEALRLRIAQLQIAPGDAAHRRSVSLLLKHLADTRESRGHIARALDMYRQSLPLTKILARSDPTNRLYQTDLATTHRRIAELELRPPV